MTHGSHEPQAHGDGQPCEPDSTCNHQWSSYATEYRATAKLRGIPPRVMRRGDVSIQPYYRLYRCRLCGAERKELIAAKE